MQHLATIAQATIPRATNRVEWHTGPEGTTDDIIRIMLDMDKKAPAYVAAFAPALRGKSTYDTVRNVWAFVRKNIRYRLDPFGLQFIKTPAQTWADKEADCKSLTIFVNALLYNLGIPYVVRYTGYGHDKQVRHVYSYVPYEGSKILVDTCLPAFNYEKPYSLVKDFPMSKIATVQGPGDSRGTLVLPKDYYELTDAEMDLLLAKQKLEIDIANMERVRGIGSLPSEGLKDRLDAVNDMLEVVTSNLSDEAKEAQLTAIQRDVVSGLYRQSDMLSGIGDIGCRCQEREMIAKKRAASRMKRDAMRTPAQKMACDTRVGNVGGLFDKIKSGLKKAASTASNVAKKVVNSKAGQIVKKVVTAPLKIVTAPIRLIAKGVMEILLPKSAAFFLYLFLQEPILSKAPAKVKTKRKRQEFFANLIVKGLNMKREHFMQLVRNGITKKFGKSPEAVLSEWAKARGINGAVGEPITMAVIASIPVILEILKKLGIGEGKPTKDDVADPNDFGALPQAAADNLASDIRTASKDPLYSDPEYSSGTGTKKTRGWCNF